MGDELSQNQRRRLSLEPLEERSMLTSLAASHFDENHAPTWTEGTSPELAAIMEDSLGNPGTSIASLTTGINDVDTNSKKGIAVISAPGEDGTWQFTLNGGKKWTEFSATSQTARLLPANAGHSRIRFVPNLDFNGTVQLGIHAWDQTQGSIGRTFDVSANTGGTTAFSEASQVADITVQPQNDAPFFKAGESSQLDEINEDQLHNTGTPVWKLVRNARDVDNNSRRGIAIVSANGNNDGTWQYRLNRGNWNNFVATSQSTLLLPTLGRVRFLPAPNFHGTVQIEYHAWDQTQGTSGGTVAIPDGELLGGTTPFSKELQQSELKIQPQNDAPIWKAGQRPQLVTINEDNLINHGTPVWKLVRNLNDVDDGSEKGIAIAFTPDENGKWQYTLNGGNQWNDFSATSQSALLLPANAEHTRIRFLPNLNFNGNVNLGLHAWDLTQGNPGRTYDLSDESSAGATSAFSRRMIYGRLKINPLNDAPVWSAGPPQLGEIREDNINHSGTPVWKLVRNVDDVDARSKKGIAVTSTPSANGRWQFTLNGGKHWKDFSATNQTARLLPANSRVRFVPNPNFNGSVNLRFVAWDQSQGKAGGTFDVSPENSLGGQSAFSARHGDSRLTIKPENDAPVWKPGQRERLNEIMEDEVNNPGTPVGKLVRNTNDFDANSKSGIAVVEASNSNGKWQYSFDRRIWNDLSTTSDESARLLPANSYVRFVPSINFNGTVRLGFHAWDQTQGNPGRTFDISAGYKRGGSTAFSSDLRYSNLIIRPLNDAPVWNARTPPLLEGIDINEFDNPGTRVSRVIKDVIDVDARSRKGIAIINADRTNGWWQYQLIGGEWTNFTASSNTARLLPSNSRFRFVPNPGFVGTVSLEYRVWDQTQGRAGGTYSIPSLERVGGTTAFSLRYHESTLSVGTT